MMGISRVAAGFTLVGACLFGDILAPIAFCVCVLIGIFNDTSRFDSKTLSVQRLREMKAIGMLHLPLLYLVIWSLGADQLNFVELVFVFGATIVWFGQIADRAAHGLIRAGHRLGLIGYASLLTGHRVSAKRLLQDPQIGSAPDMSVPRLSETYWQYARRLWRQEYSSGLTAETRKRRKRAQGLHPYLAYGVWTLATLTMSFALSGFLGLVAMLVLSVLVSGQSLLNEYIERYGLMRRVLVNGRYEEFGPRHVWHKPPSADPVVQQAKYASGQVPIWPHARLKMLWTALHPERWRVDMADRAAVWHISAQEHFDGFNFATVTASSGACSGQAPGNLATCRHEMAFDLPSVQCAQHTRVRARHERG
ncbi:MAG: hypothetical protein ABJH45_26945 [Paracoccaceae bacterium]